MNGSPKSSLRLFLLQALKLLRQKLMRNIHSKILNKFPVISENPNLTILKGSMLPAPKLGSRPTIKISQVWPLHFQKCFAPLSWCLNHALYNDGNSKYLRHFDVHIMTAPS